jgi:hypothetical protein
VCVCVCECVCALDALYIVDTEVAMLYGHIYHSYHLIPNVFYSPYR